MEVEENQLQTTIKNDVVLLISLFHTIFPLRRPKGRSRTGRRRFKTLV